MNEYKKIERTGLTLKSRRISVRKINFEKKAAIGSCYTPTWLTFTFRIKFSDKVADRV